MSRSWLRPIATTAILIACFLCFELWSWQLGRERLADIHLPGPGHTVDIEITLPFTPEGFNIQRLQAAGRLVRIDGRQAWLEAVTRDQLVDLARLYWVGDIRLWHKT